MLSLSSSPVIDFFRKVSATGKASLRCLLLAAVLVSFSGNGFAQEESSGNEVSEQTGEQADQSDRFSPKSVSIPKPVDGSQGVIYPRSVAIIGSQLYIVDLDLPGIWRRELEGDSPKLELYTPGTKLLRKAMNRPWCVTAHPTEGILIGDSASREIYHAASAGSELTALNGGWLGIPMALAVDASGENVFVGDAERRAVFRLPIGGGKPELVCRVNARGFSFDGEGKLWAVTPDAEAVYRIDPETNEADVVVGERPYQFPNGIVWTGDEGFVTDGYGKAIWRFTEDGKTEKWYEGSPLKGPVGMTADDDSIYVADPQAKEVFRFDRKTKKPVGLLGK
ncbi:MAG: hypothetical protein AAF802_06495 [Planctomycetota bacterium]